MGKTLDALLRRGFKSSKFKTLVSLAISRLAVLKNQRQVRCSQARSDALQLLQLGHQERALLRVEHVIQEQNMLDAFVMIEGYCHVLIERVALIEASRECPEELKEATASVIYATSRCGQFPELQEIRSVLTSWYGKDFAARAAELRNNCGVTTRMIQKLSTRQASLDSRMKVLKEIASENGITVQIEEQLTTSKEEKWASQRKYSKPEQILSDNLDKHELKHQAHDSIEEIEREEQLSGSLRSRKKYADVAAAAQAAFESAAYAAAAARAAVELSRSESRDNDFDDKSSPTSRHRIKQAEGEMSSKSKIGTQVHEELQHSTGKVGFVKTHTLDEYVSESESEEEAHNSGKVHPEEVREEKNKEGLTRSLSASSSNSDKDSQEIRMSSYEQKQNEILEKIAFDDSEDEMQSEGREIPWTIKHVFETDVKHSKEANEFPKIKQTNISTDSEDEGPRPRLNIERKPISVRNRLRRR